MSEILVVPRLRVVAGGIAGPGRCKATLLLTPRVVAAADNNPAAMPLRQWPSRAARWARAQLLPGQSLVTWAGNQGGVSPADGWQPVAGLAHQLDKVASWDAADQIWQATFEPINGGWQALAYALGQAAAQSSPFGVALQTSCQVERNPDEALFDYDGALITPAMPPSQVTVEGIVPIRQADFAIDEERTRAQRVVRKANFGPNSVDDTPAALRDAGAAAAGKPAYSRTEAQESERQAHLREYLRVLEQTDDDRLYAQQAYEQALAVLSGDPPACEAQRPHDTDLVMAALSTEERLRRRASYRFANWLQRSGERRYQPEGDGHRPPRVEAPTPPAAPADIDWPRAAGAYYAYQGDRLLSRLFCLAIDIEFAAPAADCTQLFLSTEPGAVGDPLRICCAAKYSENSFWPFSIFEKGFVAGCPATCVNQPELVEQNDGIWHLGSGVPDSMHGSVERYDLYSLDMRRSIESKDGAQDRGERQQTLGFSLIDRGRSRQVARDLAVAQLQQNAAPGGAAHIYLFAEQLTTGRRVDMACIAPGHRLKEPLHWASLHQRWVDFLFGDCQERQHPALAIIKALVPLPHPDKPCFPDEGCFQVNARQVPMPGDGRHINLACDEAIFLWDGKPPVQDPSQRKVALKLPVTPNRHLRSDLQHADRPAPLRYGHAYVFGMRSVFAGGSGPCLDEARRHHASTDGRDVLPAARDGCWRAQRFLRHEGISAPVLLLPGHLARNAPYGALGYEVLESAIVRSTVTRAAARGDTPDHQPPYIPLDQRSLPAQTLRVFVAPEISVDEVRRHGKLDRSDGSEDAQVRRGGLLGIGYQRAKASDAGTPPSRVDGFPWAVTYKRPGLDGEAIYAREIRTGAEPAQTGAEAVGTALFDVGGKHDVDASRYGWLPDPAAGRFSLRARIRGCERYLEGELSAELYDKQHVYPHALPLALRIEKRSGLRPGGAARRVAELLAHDSASPARLASLAGDGASGPARGGRLDRSRGPVDVRELKLALYEGEDFDLEVACLPSPATFASLFSLPETIAIQQQASTQNAQYSLIYAQECGAAQLEACAPADFQALCGIAGAAVPSCDRVFQVAKSLVDVMATRWPVEEIAAVTRLRVCHAINRPQPGQPAFLAALAAWRIPLATAAAQQQPGNGSETLAVVLSGDLQLDLERIDGFEILADTVAASGTVIDDRSRSRSSISRRSGRWPRYTTDKGERDYLSPRHVFGFDVDCQGRVTLQRERVTLLRVDQLPLAAAIPAANAADGTGTAAAPAASPPGSAATVFRSHDGRSATVALEPLFVAAANGEALQIGIPGPDNSLDLTPRTRAVRSVLPQKLADTRARRLVVTVEALSRFAEVFETAPAYVGGEEKLLRRRQALARADQSTPGNTVEVLLPATQRPASCEPRRPEPAFVVERWSARDCDGRQVHGWRRRALTRLYFARGWFSSGEGERLGVVLWPPEYFSGAHDFDKNRVRGPGRDMNLAEFADSDLGPGGAFITRWGGDPIRKDARPQDAVFIPRSAFADVDVPDANCWLSPHDPRVVASAAMPVPQQEDAGAAVAEAAHRARSAGTSGRPQQPGGREDTASASPGSHRR